MQYRLMLRYAIFLMFAVGLLFLVLVMESDRSYFLPTPAKVVQDSPEVRGMLGRVLNDVLKSQCEFNKYSGKYSCLLPFGLKGDDSVTVDVLMFVGHPERQWFTAMAYVRDLNTVPALVTDQTGAVWLTDPNLGVEVSCPQNDGGYYSSDETLIPIRR